LAQGEADDGLPAPSDNSERALIECAAAWFMSAPRDTAEEAPTNNFRDPRRI
jgi:hypothetical protein